MNWTRYIKRTAVRRVVWILVGLLVYGALSAFMPAHAQSTQCNSTVHNCSREKAYQEAVSVLEYHISNPQSWITQGEIEANVLSESSGQYLVWVGDDNNPRIQIQVRKNWMSVCPGGATWDDEYKRCNDCASQSTGQLNVNTSIWGNVSTICENSCERTTSSPLCHLVEEGSNSGYWCNYVTTPTGSMCTAGPDVPPTPPDAPDPTCPADHVRLPNGNCSPRGQCPLGQHEVDGACHPTGQCPSYHLKAPDGSCTPVPCPSGQARGADGTCKSDGNSDGIPDEDQPGGDGTNTDGMEFSGGQSCSVPPTCSGDAIMCGQARIAWQIECNTRRAESVSGGDACDQFSMPICVGEGCDPVEQKQLIIQWQAMCALRDLVSQDGDGEGDGGTATIDVGGIGEGAVDGASGTIGDGGDPGEAFSDGSEGGGGDGQLDTVGLGFGTACPALPSIEVLGVTLDFNEIGPELCDWMSLGGYIVLILSSLLSLRILAGGMNV